MAYNTKMIKTDVDKKPIPQIYNPVNDEYEVLQGANGAARHIIYGADGQPVSTTGNKLAIRASEIETQLTTIQGYVDGLEGAIGQAVADPTANTLLARLKSLEDKIDAITAGTTPAVTQLSGSNLAEAKVVNVTIAGTRQQLDDKACREVTIIAKRGNTGYIYVGKSNVSSTVYGAELGELDSITLEVSNTNEIYIDASVAGEGISYVAI